MPKKSKNQFTTAHEPVAGVNGKKTAQGRGNLGTSTMNKHTRRSYKKYRGQGWNEKYYKPFILLIIVGS